MRRITTSASTPKSQPTVSVRFVPLQLCFSSSTKTAKVMVWRKALCEETKARSSSLIKGTLKKEEEYCTRRLDRVGAGRCGLQSEGIEGEKEEEEEPLRSHAPGRAGRGRGCGHFIGREPSSSHAVCSASVLTVHRSPKLPVRRSALFTRQ